MQIAPGVVPYTLSFCLLMVTIPVIGVSKLLYPAVMARQVKVI